MPLTRERRWRRNVWSACIVRKIQIWSLLTWLYDTVDFSLRLNYTLPERYRSSGPMQSWTTIHNNQLDIHHNHATNLSSNHPPISIDNTLPSIPPSTTTMTSLFPHAAYAEDQPSAHAILYLHVWRATTMTCTAIPYLTTPASLLLSRYRHGTPFTIHRFTTRMLIHSARGLVIGSVLGVAATYGVMYGKEEIEWQDRAWRLQENEKEVRTDVVAFKGAVVATALSAVLKAKLGNGMGIGMGRVLMGGVGLGMTSGMMDMILTFARGRKPA